MSASSSAVPRTGPYRGLQNAAGWYARWRRTRPQLSPREHGLRKCSLRARDRREQFRAICCLFHDGPSASGLTSALRRRKKDQAVRAPDAATACSVAFSSRSSPLTPSPKRARCGFGSHWLIAFSDVYRLDRRNWRRSLDSSNRSRHTAANRRAANF